ncbi:hypothetical protein AX17_002792 [Amanita inopinata Kibby_2008]|nr:hypothetical protein AX17_002792 [Amanita inopinata Kibby_2008]
MDNYSMTAPEAGAHYAPPPSAQQRQNPQQQQSAQQWPTHLLPSSQAPFPSPPPSEHAHYPPFYQPSQPSAQQHQTQQPPPSSQSTDRTSCAASRPPGTGHLNRAPTTLSLNLSSLSVTSPTNLSPINAPSNHSAALSPVTPISPNTNPFNSHAHAAAAAHHHAHPPHHIHHTGHMQSPFQFDPVTPSPQASSGTGQQQGYEPERPPASSAGYDNRRTPGPSRSSSTSSTTQLPRKRSFSNNSSTVSVGGTLVEESMYDVDGRDTSMDLGGSYGDELEVRAAYGSSHVSASLGGNGNSPVDGNGSSGGEDVMGGGQHGQHGQSASLNTIGVASTSGVGGSMNVLGKPMATNNFVTKLYQMINDSKSQHFISWTELGTSFVVSNVGEFSRSILGAHFKHNNFSSFVRQLNMYGFHKINRTPRAQRTSTDAQTWEFSHHKFLRGRPDLLDEIKRKALEPDPGLKHRIELPGEVAAQLGAMRDENRRMWEQLTMERRRVEKLVGVVGRLWEVVGKGLPGSLPPFPPDILDNENPNIYITSPTSATPSRYPPPLSITNLTAGPPMHMHSVNSPSSSPTATDLPSHLHHPHHPHPHHNPSHPTLSRQHSIQHISFSRGPGGPDGLSSSSTPLQASPRSMSIDLFDDNAGGTCPATGTPLAGMSDPSSSGRGGTKRQRLSNGDGAPGPCLNGSSDSLSPMSAVSSPGTGTAGMAIGGGGLVGVAVANGKKSTSRARSDSAPLGYGFGGLTSWQGGLTGIIGRPRSGSGLAGPRGVPNIGTMTRGATSGVPLLTIPMLPTDPSPR